MAAPDDERGHVVRAVVVLRDGHAPSDDLARDLQDHVKAQTAPYKYPRIVDFVRRAAQDGQRQDPPRRAALTNDKPLAARQQRRSVREAALEVREAPEALGIEIDERRPCHR